MTRFFAIFLLLFFFQTTYSQKVQAENLSAKTKVYWDANKKFINSVGCYYIDDQHPTTTEKHGKWLFYSLEGTLEEERNYFRDRIHGKQTLYFPDKKTKRQMFCVFNVPDSTFNEWNSDGKLIISGLFDMGHPVGDWKYFYDNGVAKSVEKVIFDTTYTMEYWENDKQHTQTVKSGAGFINTYFVTGIPKERYQFEGGLKNGPFEERVANGRVSVSGFFKNGKKDSTWLFYDQNGDLEKQMGYALDSLHGSYLVYFPEGTINTAGSYQYGKKTGHWVWNLPEGKGVEMEGDFESNLQAGDWEYYYSSGELSYKANYSKGLRSGEWLYFYKDSTPYRKGVYANDLKQGFWQTWYEDGTLLMQGSYMEGKEFGVWENFWENGRIKNKATFKDGKLDGYWVSYTPNGTLILSGTYKNGLKNGHWQEYYNNGALKEEVQYKIKKLKNSNGGIIIMGMKSIQSVQHGPYKTYSQIDFTVKQSGKFKNGLKTGKWIDYYPGGVVPTIISNYKNGKLEGDFQQFGRQGNLMNDIHYKNGLKDGYFTLYNSSGKIVVQKMFRRGMEMQKSSGGDMFAP